MRATAAAPVSPSNCDVDGGLDQREARTPRNDSMERSTDVVPLDRDGTRVRPIALTEALVKLAEETQMERKY